jgi:hypothetical protein
MNKKAIITGNKSKHRFDLGEVVKVISKHKGYYKCKGTGMAHYIIPNNELQILN